MHSSCTSNIRQILPANQFSRVPTGKLSPQLAKRSWKGIPRAVRWQAWTVLVDAHALRQRETGIAPGHGEVKDTFRVRAHDTLPSSRSLHASTANVRLQAC